MPKKQETLKELQKLWYAKIALRGFVDIEDVNSPRQMLKRWVVEDFGRKRTQDYINAKRQYFLDATDMLNWYGFESVRHKRIWEMHADGQTVRKIAKKVGLKKSRTHTIIKLLQREMQRPV